MNTEALVQSWVKIASVDEIPIDGTLQRMMREHPICLYNIGGTIYATDDACTHGEASLTDGFIVDSCEIEARITRVASTCTPARLLGNRA